LTVQADAEGRFSVEVPLSKTGKVVLKATGATSGVVVSEQVTAVVSLATGGGPPRDTLAITGQSAHPYLTELAIGLGAILIGAALTFAAIRLRPRRTPSLLADLGVVVSTMSAFTRISQPPQPQDRRVGWPGGGAGPPA